MNYNHRTGATHIDFRGTALMPAARGQAGVESRLGSTKVDELLQRGQYVLNRSSYQPVKIDPKGPLQLAEAENAVQIARLAGAERYAADTFNKALSDLQNAEGFLNRSHDRKRLETNAREAAQMAEDARIIAFRKIQEEQLGIERAAAVQREADERAKAEQAAEAARLEQQRRGQAEADRKAAEDAQRKADEEAAARTTNRGHVINGNLFAVAEKSPGKHQRIAHGWPSIATRC
jgi:hypothetical protein